MGLFSDLFSNDNAEEAARLKAAGLQAGRTEAYGQLDKGFTNATGYYDKALLPFSDLYTKGSKGYDTYLDATGVNGPEGIARAGSLYKQLPGYSAGQTTGLDLLERRAAARGDLGGGNTSADTIRFASDYDSQKYKDFLASLSGQSGVAQAGAAGQGAILGQEGSLAADIGSKKANYGWGTETGIGNANAEAEMAKQQASANFWSALMGGANMALKASGVGGFGMPSFGGGSSGGMGWTPTGTSRLY
jgi:hypothetical protein